MTVRIAGAIGRYDRTWALLDGRVRPDGLEATWLQLNPEQIFWRMIQHLEFDVAEMALASHVILRSRGSHDFVGIPAFLSRAFRHDAFYVSASSGVRAPADLRGKRIGVPEYQMTTAVWLRGLLEDEYGVAPGEIEWLQGSLEQPGRIIHTPVAPPGVRLSLIPPDKTLAGMLLGGELDALMSPRMPSVFREHRGKVERLFADPWLEARSYFERTRIFPIMHLVVIRGDLVRENPWLPQTLYQAFLTAKTLADDDLVDPTALRTGLPFLVEQAEWVADHMGSDAWTYGVDENRHVLEEYIRLSVHQGLIDAPLPIDTLFAVTTQRVSRI